MRMVSAAAIYLMGILSVARAHAPQAEVDCVSHALTGVKN